MAEPGARCFGTSDRFRLFLGGGTAVAVVGVAAEEDDALPGRVAGDAVVGVGDDGSVGGGMAEVLGVVDDMLLARRPLGSFAHTAHRRPLWSLETPRAPSRRALERNAVRFERERERDCVSVNVEWVLSKCSRVVRTSILVERG